MRRRARGQLSLGSSAFSVWGLESSALCFLKDESSEDAGEEEKEQVGEEEVKLGILLVDEAV